jgi:carboxypeptidase C (cathepsin A)
MNYSSLVKEPKGDDFAIITEYQKALDGNSSSALAAALPLGRRYFENTGIRCNNMKNTRSVFIDAKPSAVSSNTSINAIQIDNNVVSADLLSDDDAKKILNELSNNGIYYSANKDFSKVSDTLNESSKYDCKKITTKQTVDVNGKTKKGTYYVGKETFISPNFQKMNMGQQFFIGSFAVLGLLLFYKGLLKR